jgi:hypothetical protein
LVQQRPAVAIAYERVVRELGELIMGEWVRVCAL